MYIFPCKSWNFCNNKHSEYEVLFKIHNVKRKKPYLTFSYFISTAVAATKERRKQSVDIVLILKFLWYSFSALSLDLDDEHSVLKEKYEKRDMKFCERSRSLSLFTRRLEEKKG